MKYYDTHDKYYRCCEEYKKCCDEHKKKKIKNIQLSFAADIGNSINLTKYVLLPYKSTTTYNYTDASGIAPTIPTTEYLALDQSIPSINEYVLNNIFISVAASNSIMDQLILNIYVYANNDPLLAVNTNPIYNTTITLNSGNVFVNDLEKINIIIPEKSYILVAYESNVNLDNVSPEFWVNVSFN